MENQQILNVRYGQPLNSEELNKIFYNLFLPGIIYGDFEFGSNFVKINSVSFLIKPENRDDIIVRIDTTEPIIINNNSIINKYLVARFRWDKENKYRGANFLFVNDDTILYNDVILVGIELNNNNQIFKLNYDCQHRACCNLINLNTKYPLVKKVDGYFIGHEENKIPINDGELNKNLNAEYFNFKSIDKFVISYPKTVINDENYEITETKIPDWMDLEKIVKGEGVTSELLNGYGIQNQDGESLPTPLNQIPVANGILQKNLNAELLNGYTSSDFAKSNHTHNLDEIADESLIKESGYIFNKVYGVIDNQITEESIDDDCIEPLKIDKIALDKGVKYNFVFACGVVNLTQYTESDEISFGRNINNARVFLQRILTDETTSGLDKRIAKVTYISTTGFKCKQLGSIKKNGNNYIRSDNDDNNSNLYYWVAIGEYME